MTESSKPTPENDGRSKVRYSESGRGIIVQVFDGDVALWDHVSFHGPHSGELSEQVASALVDEVVRLRKVETERVLTDKRIKNLTNFSLVATFTEFARQDGFISPDLYTEIDRLGVMFGEDNVLPSFYIEEGKLQLGLFVRRPEPAD